MNLKDELERLARAHSASDLASAFSQLQGTVKKQRREFHKKHGLLAQTFIVQMRVWDQQKVEGVSRDDRLNGLDIALRSAWPKGRDEPWRYNCENCDDTGLVMRECGGDAMCGRRKKPHYAHTYGEPCWCSNGGKFKTKPQSGDDFTSAGKGFSKGGR